MQTRSNHSSIGRWQRASVALLLVLAGCGDRNGSTGTSGEAPPEKMPALLELDPFPADIDVWGCAAYLDALRGTGHAATLHALLDARPHQYQEPAALGTLVEVPVDLVAANRRDHPIYRHLMDPDALQALQQMARAAAGGGLTLRIQSAYRSPGYQNLLWKIALRDFRYDLIGAAFKTAPPCFSEHATGRAVDFARTRADVAFEASPEYQWLEDNASKWGWVQSFRDDNGAVRSPNRRGIMVEPWHYRYVGVGHADETAVDSTPDR